MFPFQQNVSAKEINKKRKAPFKTSYNEGPTTITFSVLPLLRTTTTKYIKTGRMPLN